MLAVIFGFILLWTVWKLVILGVKLAWGLTKLVCGVLLLAAVVIGLAVLGLMYLALPILIFIGVVAFLAGLATA